MASQCGLHLLYEPPNGTNTSANIIFVHGLFGHPFKTWTGKKPKANSSPVPAGQSVAQPGSTGNGQVIEGERKVLWPRDLLPSVIPDVKIYTYGHDASVDHFLSSASHDTLHQKASTMLSDIADIRQTPEEQAIPIIFVVHSLGGLLVKDAINQSASIVGNRLKDIGPSVYAICFLATPHRGSSTASLGKTIYNVTRLVGKSPNTRLLSSLEKNSETLGRIGTTFSQTLLKYEIAICSFREEMPTRKLLLFNVMVVDPDSAIIGDGKEEVNSIPADHRNVTKFVDASNIGFKRVSHQLRRWVEDIRSHSGISSPDLQHCLNSLNNITARARITNVFPAHEKTFHWLFDPGVVTFACWLGNEASHHGPIYWIRGKPGSGKSTLMKFAMNDPRLRKHLGSKSECDWIVAAYFFHDRGSGIQKTLDGMLQELLYSILQQNTALLPIVTPLYAELVHMQRTETPKWDIESLEVALVAIVEQKEIRTRILLFIDALDEHSGDNDKLVSLLNRLIQKSEQGSCMLKLCLASRPWTVFEKQFYTCPGFAIHQHTRKDIQTYIESQLRPSHGVEPSINAQDLSQIIDIITEKALGVFIWVKLVIDVVSKGIRDGTPYYKLRADVDSMPRELKDLYADTLRRVEPSYSREAFIMLHMVYSSLVPLPLDTFMTSLDVNLTNKFNISPFGPTETAAEYLAAQKSRLASRTGGLLEIVPAGAQIRSAQYPWNLVVQFIHQTVKDYIQDSPHELSLINITPEFRKQSGNLFLLKACYYDRKAWSCAIKRDIFTYASGAFADKDFNPDDINRFLEDALSVENVSGLNEYASDPLNGATPLSIGTSSTNSLAEATGRESIADVTRSERGKELQHDAEKDEASQSNVSENMDLSATTPDQPSPKFLITEDKRPKRVYGLIWWLEEYSKATASHEVKNFCSFLTDICTSDRYRARDRVLAMLAVAMRFEGYVWLALPNSTLSEFGKISPGLLHLAAAGPEMKMPNSSTDRSRIIKLLMQKGHNIDEVYDCSTFGNNEIVDSKDEWTLSPVAYLLLHRGEQDEKSRLRVAKTLFALGASPLPSIVNNFSDSLYFDNGIFIPSVRNSAIGYCVASENAAFVRLWLHQIDVQEAEYFTIETASNLLHIAVNRQNKAINEILQERGFKITFDPETANSSSRIAQFGLKEALFMSTQILSGASGGLGASLNDPKFQRDLTKDDLDKIRSVVGSKL